MILFFILFFGFLSAYRILFFEKNNFIVFKNQKISTKNVTLVFFTLTFLLFFPLKTVFLLFFIFCTLLFLYFLVQRVWKSLKDKRFEKFFVLFLDQVILFVQCGDSFRSAFKSSIKFVPELFHQELQEMYERVTFSQQIPHFSHSQLKKHLLSKLISIDKGKENPLSALKNLRTELHLASLFRHKSMQITASAVQRCTCAGT